MKDLDPATRELLDEGAAELWRDGSRVGHVTTALERGWGSGPPLGTQTFVWLLVTLEDGVRYVIEDYPPYATVPDAVAGRLEPEDSAEGTYEVRWLEGPARAQVWMKLGIHESFGSYRRRRVAPDRPVVVTPAGRGSRSAVVSPERQVPHITGDSLFRGDWEDNDPAELHEPYRRPGGPVFGQFDDGTWFYPGHGNDSTLGAERPHIPEWRARGCSPKDGFRDRPARLEMLA